VHVDAPFTFADISTFPPVGDSALELDVNAVMTGGLVVADAATKGSAIVATTVANPTASRADATSRV